MSKCILAVVLVGLCALASLNFVMGHPKLHAAMQPGVHEPTLTSQNSNTTQGLIAVSPVNSRVVWASGRGGTFVVTTDGGQTWRSGVVPGASGLQFRDVNFRRLNPS